MEIGLEFDDDLFEEAKQKNSDSPLACYNAKIVEPGVSRRHERIGAIVVQVHNSFPRFHQVKQYRIVAIIFW